jgi:hypothetical protein
MKRSRAWLIVTAVAFVAWIGYLIHVTQTGDRPSITLSRPQLLVSERVVIAHVTNRNGPVKVQEVIPAPTEIVKPGVEVKIKGLGDSLHKRLNDPHSLEWELPGDFIIPLQAVVPETDGTVTAEVTPLPPSPGLPHGRMIYPVTADTRAQLRNIPIGNR